MSTKRPEYAAGYGRRIPSENRRKATVKWKRPRSEDLRTGTRTYTERRRGERRKEQRGD